MKTTVMISVLLLVAAPALAIGPGNGRCKAAAGNGGGCCGMGRGQGPGPGAGYRGGRASDHDTIHALLDRHESIERSVDEIEGGVETVTVSKDPEVAALIREHARDMKQRVESGHGMRWWDPTFAELFEHHEKIVMEIEEVEGGVKVRETSDDPNVVLLIRQHAVRGVSEFVAAGRARAHRETPLPEGYTNP